MGQADTGKSVISKIRFSDEQRELVEGYLVRTTLLWNYLVAHTEKEIKEYMDQPMSARYDDMMSARLIELEDAIYDFNPESPSSAIEKEWLEYIPKIKELDEDLITSRVDDFERAYKLAKRDKVECKLKQPTGVPQQKNERSSQSVRFGSNHFTLTQGLITLNTNPKGQIFVPGFVAVQGIDSWKKSELIVTRRRQQASISGDYGPSGKAKVVYTITIREVV